MPVPVPEPVADPVPLPFSFDFNLRILWSPEKQDGGEAVSKGGTRADQGRSRQTRDTRKAGECASVAMW